MPQSTGIVFSSPINFIFFLKLLFFWQSQIMNSKTEGIFEASFQEIVNLLQLLTKTDRQPPVALFGVLRDISSIVLPIVQHQAKIDDEDVTKFLSGVAEEILKSTALISDLNSVGVDLGVICSRMKTLCQAKKSENFNLSMQYLYERIV